MFRSMLRRRRRPAGTPLDRALAAARAAFADAARSTGQVVAGPFHAEVGYELLYWIPFLRWALEVEPSLAGRLVAVSRGGTRAWYAGIADEYVELYDLVGPAELEAGREAVAEETRGSRKQVVESSLDRRLDELVAERVEAGAAIHPSLLFGLVRELIRRPLPRGKDLPLRFEAMAQPAAPPFELPERFVAVRFYARPSFPATAENVELVRSIVASVAADQEIVLLNPGNRYDDHADFEPPPGVRTLAGATTDAENLALQAAVVARASAFVGTYGGLAYLPSFLGVPSLSFYSATNFLPQHLELAGRVFAEPPYGRFVAVDTRSLELLRLALGGLRHLP